MHRFSTLLATPLACILFGLSFAPTAMATEQTKQRAIYVTSYTDGFLIESETIQGQADPESLFYEGFLYFLNYMDKSTEKSVIPTSIWLRGFTFVDNQKRTEKVIRFCTATLGKVRGSQEMLDWHANFCEDTAEKKAKFEECLARLERSYLDWKSVQVDCR